MEELLPEEKSLCSPEKWTTSARHLAELGRARIRGNTYPRATAVRLCHCQKCGQWKIRWLSESLTGAEETGTSLNKDWCRCGTDYERVIERF